MNQHDVAFYITDKQASQIFLCLLLALLGLIALALYEVEHIAKKKNKRGPWDKK